MKRKRGKVDTQGAKINAPTEQRKDLKELFAGTLQQVEKGTDWRNEVKSIKELTLAYLGEVTRATGGTNKSRVAMDKLIGELQGLKGRSICSDKARRI